MAAKKAKKAADPKQVSLRAGDPESTRVVGIYRKNRVIGAGCLLTSNLVLTCRHVVETALGVSAPRLAKGAKVTMRLSGVEPPIEVAGRLEDWSREDGPANDLALVRFDLPGGRLLQIAEASFATPFRHADKRFSVVGFPEYNDDGYYASGVMHGPNVSGLVQLDSSGQIKIQGGYSGAPVWCPEVRAYIGIVCSGLPGERVAWCIPSRLVARFHPELRVRLRVVRADRPDIHDARDDDPNRELFGTASESSRARLSVTKITRARGGHRVYVRYECLPDGTAPPRGRCVTFITHPRFDKEWEDAYELFSDLEDGVATNYFWTKWPFTVAAIGDAGDTALTYDISRHPDWRRSAR
jgi:hypothetical protein